MVQTVSGHAMLVSFVSLTAKEREKKKHLLLIQFTDRKNPNSLLRMRDCLTSPTLTTFMADRVWVFWLLLLNCFLQSVVLDEA